MTTVRIDLPEGVTPEEANPLLAIKLWEKERLSLGQAAEMAGHSTATFMEILGKQRLPVVRYSPEELDSEQALYGSIP